MHKKQLKIQGLRFARSLQFVIIGSLTFGMAACGTGGKFAGDPNTIQNQTNGHASDANLQYQWSVAQQMVASGVRLNAFNTSEWTQDPLALTEKPKGVIVTCQPDVPFSEIARVTGNQAWVTSHLGDSVMSNTIFMNGNIPVHGYTISDSSSEKIITACSAVGQIFDAPANIGDAEYEMENTILYRLGHSVDNR